MCYMFTYCMLQALNNTPHAQDYESDPDHPYAVDPRARPALDLASGPGPYDPGQVPPPPPRSTPASAPAEAPARRRRERCGSAAGGLAATAAAHRRARVALD